MSAINHITFSVSDLGKSIQFYKEVFDAALVFRDESTAYLDANGLWLALNLQPDIPRQEIRLSYTHLAFTIGSADIIPMKQRLVGLGVELRPDRVRNVAEGQSLYFADPDGHLLEFHTGDLATRLHLYNNVGTVEHSGELDLGNVNKCSSVADKQ